jgi:hypothetical protein
MRKTAPSVRPSSRPGSEWDRSVYSLPCGAHQHQPSARTIRGRCAVGCHRAEPSSENVRRPAAVRSPGATLAYAEHWNGAVPCSSVQHTPVASSATAPACSPRSRCFVFLRPRFCATSSDRVWFSRPAALSRLASRVLQLGERRGVRPARPR